MPPGLRIPPFLTIDFVDSPDDESIAQMHSSKSKRHSVGKELHQIGGKENLDGSYNFVVCNRLSDNFLDPIKAFQLCLRVLQPGGILYISTGSESNLTRYISDMQSKKSEIRILDSAANKDEKGELTYIIEKVDYIPEAIGILKENPEPEVEYSIDVVVPIYNAFEDVEKCIYSLLKHQDVYRIILINDCSADKRIKELFNTLRKYRCKKLEIVENKENLGYLKTANIGMKMSKKDVILLNSDTIVTTGWAKKLNQCAYSRHCIGIVTPFSNNGVECSIPEPSQDNEIPEGFSIESFAELVEKCSLNRYPELVTSVGFCMYIRRSVIDEIGYLDEKNFGLGFGEENDFSMRASRIGYKSVLCDNTFIFHKGAASFSTRRNALIQKSAKVLDQMYPDFWPAMHLFWQTKPLQVFRDNIKGALELHKMKRTSFQ